MTKTQSQLTIRPEFNIDLRGHRKNYNDPKFNVREITVESEYLDASEVFASDRDAELFEEAVLSILSESFHRNFVTESDLKRELAAGRYASLESQKRGTRFPIGRNIDGLHRALSLRGFRIFSVSNADNRHLATIVTL